MKQELCQLKEKLTQANTLLLQNVNENADNQRMHKYLGDNLHDLKAKHNQMEVKHNSFGPSRVHT